MSSIIACELCDANFTDVGPDGKDTAEKVGWRITWDGWLCPKHAKELSEDSQIEESLDE